MKLIAPTLQIEENDSFKKDILGRSEYGEALASIVKKSDDALVICLDGKWGEGKTTFVKMWRGLLLESNIRSIYVDAFASDFVEEPFFAVASAISEFVENSDISIETKSSLKISTLKVGTQLLAWSLKIGAKAATLGAINETDIESLETIGSDISDGVSSALSKYVERKLENYTKSLDVIESYRNILSKIPSSLGQEYFSRLVVIIDELDRCKPNFAVSIIEQVKHLFSVPNVVFVLVMNKSQMLESIRSVYGQGIDANTYLQKFINVETGIPKRTEHRGNNDINKYIKHLWNVHSFEAWGDQQNVVDCLDVLANYYNLSLRQIERVFTNIALLYSISSKNRLRLVPVIVFLSVVKVIDSDTFKEIADGQINYQKTVEKLQLNSKSFSENQQRNVDWMMQWIRFSMLTDKEFSELQPDDALKDFGRSLFSYSISRNQIIPFFAGQLRSFSVLL